MYNQFCPQGNPAVMPHAACSFFLFFFRTEILRCIPNNLPFRLSTFVLRLKERYDGTSDTRVGLGYFRVESSAQCGVSACQHSSFLSSIATGNENTWAPKNRGKPRYIGVNLLRQRRTGVPKILISNGNFLLSIMRTLGPAVPSVLITNNNVENRSYIDSFCFVSDVVHHN